jgi:hypothetical protein
MRMRPKAVIYDEPKVGGDMEKEADVLGPVAVATAISRSSRSVSQGLLEVSVRMFDCAS